MKWMAQVPSSGTQWDLIVKQGVTLWLASPQHFRPTWFGEDHGHLGVHELGLAILVQLWHK